MIDLRITILGSSSAVPISSRNPTSQFLTLANRHFLIDCGEGTQVQLRRNKIGFGRISHIMISHMHGDHFYGLVPLLSSLHLLDRHKEMHLYGPPELEGAVYHLLQVSGSRVRFPLIFHVLDMKNRSLIYEDKAVTVHSIPLKHSLPCCGFVFREKAGMRKFRKEMLQKYSIPGPEIRKIKEGADWVDEKGNVVKNEDLTTDPREPVSYAFCTDTLPLADLGDLIGTPPTVLYHEATFTESHRERARQTKHSTALQAATVAGQSGAKNLLIGHFSIRYENLQELLEEALPVFPDTYLAEEGITFHLKSTHKLVAERQASSFSPV